MFLYKKIWCFFIAIVLCLLFCFLHIGTITVYNVSNTYLNKRKTIIVDAGHGGFDGGAMVNGVFEKDINLKIALNLKDCLSMIGYDIILTRKNDDAINTKGTNIRTKKISDMQNRLNIMKNYPEALFVSIHLNIYENSAINGAQVFYSNNDLLSNNLARSIQRSIKNNLQKNNNRQIKMAQKNVYLLYNAPIPACIVECGFLSNSLDFKNLTNENYQKKMAISIFCGIINKEL